MNFINDLLKNLIFLFEWYIVGLKLLLLYCSDMLAAIV